MDKNIVSALDRFLFRELLQKRPIWLSYLRELIWRSDICFCVNTIFKCNYIEKHLFVPLKFIKKFYSPSNDNNLI